MRRCLRALPLALMLASSFAAKAGATSPAETMRELRRLQDRIATGDTVAGAAHAKAVQRTAQAFAREPLKSWQDKKNARALVAYLFSGGDPMTIGGAIPKSALPADIQTLYAGAIAYGMSDEAEAKKLLLPIDAKSMTSGIDGHLALVQATLVSHDDAKRAIALLDLARLLEPGTLVEEAALRKEMSLIGESGDLDKFALLSRRYLNAFAHSIYVDNFRQLVAADALKLGSGNSDDDAAKLTKLMSGLDKTERRRLYLAIARQAVVAGRTTMAMLASEAGGRLATDTKSDEARAMTYFGAAAVVGDRYELGMKALSTVDAARLDGRDQELRTSALAVAAMIREPAKAEKALDDKKVARAELYADAEQSLGQASDLLKSLAK